MTRTPRLPRLASRLAAIACIFTSVLAHAQALVSLDAADLPDGELVSWVNRGALRRSFDADSPDRPAVTTVDGRRAVVFGDKKWLTSSFLSPPSITRDGSYTLLVWARAPKASGKQVMVSWASRPTDCAEFAYGAGPEGAFCSYGSGNLGWRPSLPEPDAWHHFAFVHAPGAMRIYVDGELCVNQPMTLRTRDGEPVRIGAGWERAKNAGCYPWRGAIAAVQIHDRALSAREIRNLGGRFESFEPYPADGSTVEDRRIALRWQPGRAEAKAFDVYFGEERSAVETAARDSALCIARGASAASSAPMDLTLGRECFWRVDQLDESGKVIQKGATWRFSVSAGPATSPAPRDTVAGVKRSIAQLSWTPGKYAVSQSVHFGTNADEVARSQAPAVKGLPASAKSCPLPLKSLEYGRTYYWRVEQDNGDLPPARGPVWSFRVEDEPVANDVTFFTGSDLHYGREDIEEHARATIDVMNRLPGTPMPASLGGLVRTPRGVILNGDLLDNGTDVRTAPIVWSRFVRDVGLHGEARLAYPVYEGFGNHDGGPDASLVRAAIRKRNMRRQGLAMVCENSLHYSWDWDHVHFVQLNLFAGDGPEDVASVNGKSHDPVKALAFLKEDLRRNVGDSGRPVVICQHFGLPPDGMSHWWSGDAQQRFLEAVRGYNVVAILHGHSHAATIYRWNDLLVIADGAMSRPERPPGDFFVIRITKDELVAAHRIPGGWGDTVREPIKAPAGRRAP